MRGDRARRRLAQLGVAARACCCTRRGLTPRFREVPHDEVLDAARARTGALVIGDAGFAAAGALPARRRSRRGLARADRPAVRLRGVGRARPARSAAEDVALLQREPGARARRRGRDRAAPGPRRTAAIRPLRALPHATTSATSLGAEELVGPVGASSIGARARAGLAAAPGAARGCSTSARAPRAAPRRAVDDRSTPCSPTPPPASACRPTTALRLSRRRRLLELGVAADAAPPGAAPATASSPTSSIATSTTRTSASPRCKLLRVLPAARPTRPRATCCRARSSARSSRRRSTRAACRSCCRAASTRSCRIELVRGPLPLDEGEVPARPSTALSPEEIRYIAEIENMSIREVHRAAHRGRASTRSPAAAPRSSSTRSATQISPLKCTTRQWLEVMREAHAWGCARRATMMFGFGEQPRHVVAHL